MAKKRKGLRYWLRGGTETCERCGSSYLLQMEYRCGACDAGICEQCALVIDEQHDVFCSDCHQSETEAR